jgi:hypothetical protein
MCINATQSVNTFFKNIFRYFLAPVLHNSQVMALGAQLPVRLDQDDDERLQKVAADTGTTKSSLIRLLIHTFCQQCIKPGNRVLLPPNWRDYCKPYDGRGLVNRRATYPEPIPAPLALNETPPNSTSDTAAPVPLASAGLAQVVAQGSAPKQKVESPSGKNAARSAASPPVRSVRPKPPVPAPKPPAS